MSKVLIGVLAFLLVMAVVGAIRGFAKTILAVAAFALAVALVWVSAPYVSSEVKAKTDIDERLSEKISAKLLDMIESDNDLQTRLDKLPLADTAKEVIQNTSTAIDKKVEELGRYLADLFLRAAVCLALFVIFFIVLKIIACLISRLADSDGLRFINRTAGGLLGILEGVIVLDIAALALVFFAGTDFGVKAFDAIYGNEILTWLYDNNLLLMLVNRYMG